MPTSNAAPMLGARCPNYGYVPFATRCNVKPRPWTTFERRIAKLAERENWQAEIAQVTDYVDDIERLDREADAMYALEALYAEEAEESAFCGCGCRRCVLHDDHGGCTEPWNHRVGTYHADSEGGFYA